MSYHSFSLDPRTVLGVGPDASLDEIHDAYRVKSKKHHPDVGGDEWAFRMVMRAYEVLKTTAGASSSKPWCTHVADIGQQGQAPDWSRIWSPPFSKCSSASTSEDNMDAMAEAPGGARCEGEQNAWSETDAREGQSLISEPDELRIVDVELIWTRFEKVGSGRLLSSQERDDATLSVCLVISWPPHELLNRAAEFVSTSSTLKFVIAIFESLRDQKPVIAARSRIEDGRFVGWLSYVDVLTAQDSFLCLRDAFQTRGLTVKLYTRDERVPFDWYGAGHDPVMSHVS
jgi:DnaJ domain